MKNIRNSIRDYPNWDSVRDSVMEKSVGFTVWHSVWKSLRSPVWNSVRHIVKDNL